MPLFFSEKTEHTITAVWKITETIEALASLHPQGEALLSFALSQFSSRQRQTEWLATRILLHLYSEESEIKHYESGKPYLENSNWEISISHTKGFAAIQLCDKLATGIDIEMFRPRIIALREKFISSCDCNKQNPLLDKLRQTTLLWCAKEAGFKYFSEQGALTIIDITIKDIDFENNLLTLFCNKQDEKQDARFSFIFFAEILFLYSVQPYKVPKYRRKRP